MQARPTTPAVDSAIRILQLLVKHPYPLTQAEISHLTDIPPASCYRILGSLLNTQLITADPERKKSYCIGPAIFQMASTIFGRQSLIPHFYPIAEILKNEVHKTVLMSIPVGKKVVVVARLEASPSHGYHIHVGQTLPMHRAAAGKAILGMRSPHYLEDYLKTEQIAGEITPLEIDGLAEQLARMQRLGYAVTRGEIDNTVACLAAPIVNLSNEPVAALGICVSNQGLTDQHIRSYSAPLIQAALQLAARIR